MATRYTIGSGLVITALALTLIALLIPVNSFGSRPAAAVAGPAGTAGPAGADDDGGGTLSTAFGPLTAADRDFVRKVRLAGLWELPAGRQAQQRGSRPAIKTAGQHLIDGHTELDRQVIQVGQALGVDLPNQPSAQQQDWLGQLNRARGEEYERLFVMLLRRAHGKVFALLAQIRAQTKNSMVRALATSANTTVLDHITVLEDTGLVDFDALSDNVQPTK
ncbi:DUF4142 domain-containing protein [Streptomyces nojiriensis]|uniref:DUF4142 domain-containing protein n=1 Tax=Streptomyces nojiriensis TaxID=66374 RepID=A0ABQ3SHL7_9ACTN|nr:DUF4142 domain-containing protein [Streptomyces nojiriensis]GGS10914.1 hypothetical protein GCM10010205_45480 [Streptomyces nojiriensis]GHI67537.1 hypothetical protein Snoj_14550 [Streptomyces nojiriensis]